MNKIEFARFRRHYASRFTGFADWLATLDNRDDVMQNWLGVLTAADIADAIRAVDWIAQDVSEHEWYTNRVSGHPYQIAAKSKSFADARESQKPTLRVVAGKVTYRCAKCLDQGLVIIFSPEAIRSVEAAGVYIEAAVRYPSVSVRCDCEAGARGCSATQVVFSEKSDFLWSIIPAEFVAWVAARKAHKIERHPNYADEFSAFA